MEKACPHDDMKDGDRTDIMVCKILLEHVQYEQNILHS